MTIHAGVTTDAAQGQHRRTLPRTLTLNRISRARGRANYLLTQPTNGSLQYGAEQPLIYLRIWPRDEIPPLGVELLNDYAKSVIEPLGGRTAGWSYDRNRHGLLTYGVQGNPESLSATTQVFRNGEIWGINEHFLRKRDGLPDLVPMKAYEDGLRQSLAKYLKVARDHFGYPPDIMVESGLVNVGNFRLAVANSDLWGPIYEDVQITATVNAHVPESVTKALRKILKVVYAAAGRSRPENL